MLDRMVPALSSAMPNQPKLHILFLHPYPVRAGDFLACQMLRNASDLAECSSSYSIVASSTPDRRQVCEIFETGANQIAACSYRPPSSEGG